VVVWNALLCWLGQDVWLMQVRTVARSATQPSELASPRREWQNLTLVPVRALAQADSFRFERGTVSLSERLT